MAEPGLKLPDVHPKNAYEAGQKAKRFGWWRISPYTDQVVTDHFFFAGYDGKTWEDAIKTQEES